MDILLFRDNCYFFQYACFAEILFEQLLIRSATGVTGNGYFTFQMIIDIAWAHGNVVCVGSPVIIIIILQQISARKFWNFQPE